MSKEQIDTLKMQNIELIKLNVRLLRIIADVIKK